MSRKKILFVIGGLDVGGTEMHLLKLLPEFPKSEFEIILYTISNNGALRGSFEENKIKVVSISGNSLISNFRYFRLIATTFKFIKLILNYKPTIIHFFLPQAYIFGSICALFTRHKCLVMSRRSMNYYQKNHPVLSVIERKLHPKMSAILANSKSVKKNLEDEGVKTNHINIIYNGVNLNTFGQYLYSNMEIRKKLNIKHDALVFIKVANLIGYKGHEDLLNSLAQIKDELPTKWNLICIGRDDGILKQLKKTSIKLGLNQHVSWITSCKDVSSYLNASDIGILCSHEEGFSNSLLEGMASKLPMIVTNVGGNSEAIIHNKNGLVVPVSDVNKLSQAILKLSQNKSLRDKFGLLAYERVEKNFTLKKCVQEYTFFYKDLVSENLELKATLNQNDQVIKEFGEEWTKYNFTNLSKERVYERFKEYFHIFPWSQISKESIGFDMGCGSGRWSQFIAPKVKKLYCIDPSKAINVAKSNLKEFSNVRYLQETTATCSLNDTSQDFGFCLGVLHHIPDTESALKDCSRLLKKGAPFLLYLYYDFENKPWWFIGIWKISDLFRKIISILPKIPKNLICDFIAITIYFPLSRLSLLLESLGLDVSSIPLSDYRKEPFYMCRNDALDRFGTRLEQRFSKLEVTVMLENAGFENIKISNGAPYWLYLAFKR